MVRLICLNLRSIDLKLDTDRLGMGVMNLTVSAPRDLEGSSAHVCLVVRYITLSLCVSGPTNFVAAECGYGWRDIALSHRS